MKQKIMMLFLAIIMCYTFTIPIVNVQAAQTLTNNATGTIDGYDYELWKDSGTTSMTLNGGGKFSCSWSNINNALFRIGKKLGETQTYQQLGNIVETYGCNYQPNGNSYLAIYGWTTNPLVEYYIIESYGTWRPPGNDKPLKGTITVDGGTYEVYQNSRTGPSIKGDTTFQQYWSVRTSKRTSGTISVSDHFKAWESKYGMQMGKMYEVSLVVEGYQSSGSADVYSNTLTIGGNPTPTPSTGPNPPTHSTGPTPTPTPTPTVTVIQGNYAVTYNVQSSWGTGGTVNVTIKNNTSTPVNGWTLAFAFPSGQTITNLWNGSYTQSGASASVKNASYNAAIGAGGGSVSFGFNYNGSGGNPTSFTLNGAACTVQ